MGRVARLLLSAGVAFGLCAGTLGSPPRVSASPSVEPSGADASDPLAWLYPSGLALQSRGLDAFPSTFGNVAVDRAHGRIDVYTTDLASAPALLQGLNPSLFAFHPTDYSYQSLMELESRVSQDWDSWAAKGIRIEFWGPRIGVRDDLELDVVDASPADTAQLVAAYGPAVDVEPAPAAVATATFDNDSSPYKGGIELQNETAVALCTGGFTNMGNNGAGYIFTAGHCGAGNYSNGTFSHTIGSVTNNSQYATNGVDAEQIKICASESCIAGYTYNTSNATRAVVGLQGNMVNQLVYKFGLTTQGTQAITTSTGNCQHVTPVATCNEVFANGGGPGTQTAGSGDSGGPVYVVRGDSAFNGAGLTSLTFETGGGGLMPCSGDSSASCGNNIGFTDLTAVLNLYNTHLKTPTN